MKRDTITRTWTWTPVQVHGQVSAPVARFKCAATLSTSDGFVYLYGGRSIHNVPLRDLWRFDPSSAEWVHLTEQIVNCRDAEHEEDLRPPALQLHTLTEWQGKLFIIGGSGGGALNMAVSRIIPIWILDLATLHWKRLEDLAFQNRIQFGNASCDGPSPRMGHSAALVSAEKDGTLGASIVLYGGFVESNGTSSSELWTLDLETCQWTLNSSIRTSSRKSSIPKGRHSHSAIIRTLKDESELVIYGGLSGLRAKGDCWKWNFLTRTWTRLKTGSHGPGRLHGHTCVYVPEPEDAMIVYGGQRDGSPLSGPNDSLWKLSLKSAVWSRIRIPTTDSSVPPLRYWHVAVAVPIDSCHLCGKESAPCIKSKPKKSMSICFGQEKHLIHDERGHVDKRRRGASLFSLDCRKNSRSDSDDENEAVTDYHDGEPDDDDTIAAIVDECDLVTNDEDDDSGSEQNCDADEEQEVMRLDRFKRRIQKSISSDAVLRQNCGVLNLDSIVLRRRPSRVVRRSSGMGTSASMRPRPRSEVIVHSNLGITPEHDDDEEGYNWDNDLVNKRHSVHQSMSYYSLCFPSPSAQPKNGNEIKTGSGHCDKTNDATASRQIRPTSNHNCAPLSHPVHQSTALQSKEVIVKRFGARPAAIMIPSGTCASSGSGTESTESSSESNNKQEQFTVRNNHASPQQSTASGPMIKPVSSDDDHGARSGIVQSVSHSSSGYNSFGDESQMLINPVQIRRKASGTRHPTNMGDVSESREVIAAQQHQHQQLPPSLDHSKWREIRTRSLPRSISHYASNCGNASSSNNRWTSPPQPPQRIQSIMETSVLPTRRSLPKSLSYSAATNELNNSQSVNCTSGRRLRCHCISAKRRGSGSFATPGFAMMILGGREVDFRSSGTIPIWQLYF